MGGAVWVPSLVTLGFAVLTAVFDAELITRYPMAGGVRHALGKPSLSFLIGFCMVAAGVINTTDVCRRLPRCASRRANRDDGLGVPQHRCVAYARGIDVLARQCGGDLGSRFRFSCPWCCWLPGFLCAGRAILHGRSSPRSAYHQPSSCWGCLDRFSVHSSASRCRSTSRIPPVRACCCSPRGAPGASCDRLLMGLGALLYGIGRWQKCRRG